MQHSKNKQKRRLLNSWITSLISISLVLVLVGLLTFILINAQQLSNYVREKIGFTLVLKENLKEVEIIRLQKVLNSTEYVKSTTFISKKEAAKSLTDELGEDFTTFLGYNPLYASLDVKLVAKYTQTDSIKMLENKFENYPQVADVYYQKDIVTLINKNIRKISIAILIVSGLLTFVFFGLINNTIRILIYSKRFTINTMQMVGATKAYIRKPFLVRNIMLGIYGAFVANVMLCFGIYTLNKELSAGVINKELLLTTGIIVGMVFVFGIIISFISSWFALNKFLRLRFDELFY